MTRTRLTIKLLFCLLAIQLVSCQQGTSKCELTVKVNDYDDGDKLELISFDKQTVLKELIVQNDHAEGTIQLKSSPYPILMNSKKRGQYRFIWLEPSKMEVDASKTNLKEAVITGSKTQSIYDQHQKAILDKSGQERIDIEQQFILEHINNYYTTGILSLRASDWGKEKTSEFYEMLNKEMKSSKYGKDIATYLNSN